MENEKKSETLKQDGDCLHCKGRGCEACSANYTSSYTATPLPKRIVKKYTKDFLGDRSRKKREAILLPQGYKVIEEEEIKEWQAGNACCLALIFLPLIFIKTKLIKVTYER